MALLKSIFIGEPPGKGPFGTHRWAPLGSIICGFTRSLSMPVCSGGDSFFFFTNSKNSATCRAYLYENAEF
jgi:hypothetical protein